MTEKKRAVTAVRSDPCRTLTEFRIDSVHDHEGDVNRVDFSVNPLSFTLLHNVPQCFEMFHDHMQQWQFYMCIYICSTCSMGFHSASQTSGSAVEAVKIQGRRGS